MHIQKQLRMRRLQVVSTNCFPTVQMTGHEPGTRSIADGQRVDLQRRA